MEYNYPKFTPERKKTHTILIPNMALSLIHIYLAQGLDVAVAQLCREAGGIAGDGSLTGEVQTAAGHRAGVHGKAKLCPEGPPEGQQDVYKRQS